MNSMDMKSRLAGIKKFLRPRSRSEGFLASSHLARALFGPTPETAAGEKSRDLVGFLKQVKCSGLMIKQYVEHERSRTADARLP